MNPIVATLALAALLLTSCGSEHFQRSEQRGAPTPLMDQPTKREGTQNVETIMSTESIQAGIPAIDLNAPKEFETATFALG